MDIDNDIKAALECVNKGGIILYPTDTIWGLGCDATNSEAVRKIYKLKKRSDSKSMLTLVHNEATLERLVEEVPETAWQLLEVATYPLTLILDNPKGVAPELISQDNTLGVRITKERFSNTLCQRLGKPLVSTSANISGQPSPRFFDEISDEIKQNVDYIVKYRHDDITPRAPSNIIKISNNGVFKIIR